jgi:hypothetical protein
MARVRKAIEDELQRFTLRVTRRTVPIIFSMMLVQARERRNSAGDGGAASDAGAPDFAAAARACWTSS